MPELVSGIGGTTGALAWLGLAHGLWMGLAAPAAATLLLKARPGLSRPARHRILLGAFLLATVGPFVVGALHRGAARRSEGGAVGVATIAVAPATGAADRPVERREASPRGVDRPDVRRRAVARLASQARPWVLACWGSGMAGMIGVAGLGVCASRRLLKQGRPAPETVASEARRLARGIGLRRCPPLLVHDSVGEPCLCGIVRPSIVLPAAWLGTARPGAVSAVLAHELAHARSRDLMSHLIQRFLEALVLFHPGARRLSRALRLQREHRADALAVRLTGDPRGLAEALEVFARIRLAPRRRGPLGASLGGESSTLLPRIQEILDMTSNPERIGPRPAVALPVAGLLALAVSTCGLARDEPAARGAAERRPETEPSAVPAAIVADEERGEGPQISYEVRLLEVDDHRFGIDFDLVAEGEGEGEPVPIAFLSALERRILIDAVSRSPSDWMIQAPWVSCFEGAEALIRFPDEPGRDLGGDAPSTTVEVTGAIAAETSLNHVRMSIRLAEEDGGEGGGRRDREEAEGRQVTCTLPSGSSVMLDASAPAGAEARGRHRLILVTPRRIVILTDEEERPLIQRPGAVRQPPTGLPPRG